MKFIPQLLLVLAFAAAQAGRSQDADHPVVSTQDEIRGWLGATLHSYPILPAKRLYTLPSQARWALEDTRGRLWLGAQRRTNARDVAQKIIAKSKLNIELAFKETRPYVPDAEAIFEDSSGRIWFIIETERQEYAVGYDGKVFWECPMPLYDTGCHQNIYEDGKGRVWFMGKQAITRLEGGKFTTTPMPPGVDLDKYDIPVNTWFAGSEDGLVLLLGWIAEHKIWCFNEGEFFSVEIPPQSCPLPLNGGKIYIAGTDWVYSLKEAKLEQNEELASLVKQLNNDEFGKREKATEELVQKARAYRAALEALAKTTEDVETRQRILSILQTWAAAKPKSEDSVIVISTSAHRGKGSICWMNVIDAVTHVEKHEVYLIDSKGKRTLVPVVAGTNQTMRWDSRGYPLFDNTYFSGEEFKAAVPKEWLDRNGCVQVVDKDGRVFFNRWKLEMFDPRVPATPSAKWRIWSYARWVSANSNTAAVASFMNKADENRNSDYVEKEHIAAGLYMRIKGAWKPVLEQEQAILSSNIFATSPTNMVIRKELADTNCWLLELTTGKVSGAQNLLELIKNNRDAIVRAFSGDTSGHEPQTKLTADGDRQVWYIVPKSDNTTLGEKIVCVTNNGPVDFTGEFGTKFPSCTTPMTLVRVPGRKDVIANVNFYAGGGAKTAPLSMQMSGKTPVMQHLYENPAALKIASNSFFLTSDNTLSIGWGGGRGCVELKGEQVALQPKLRPPVLEFPKGVLWRSEYVKSTKGLGLAGLEVAGNGKTWHIPLDLTDTHSPPVADSTGRVWIAVATGLRGYKLDDDGPKLVHEIPYDRVGRSFWNLQIDQEGGAWLWDSEVNEVLWISLP